MRIATTVLVVAFALVIVLAALRTPALAEGSYQHEPELNLVRTVAVTVEDHVRDGCLANPNVLQVEAELILRRSRISLVPQYIPQQQGAFSLSIFAFGHGRIGVCVWSDWTFNYTASQKLPKAT
jgi:hypothetical protein